MGSPDAASDAAHAAKFRGFPGVLASHRRVAYLRRRHMLNRWLEKLQHLFTGGGVDGEGNPKTGKKDALGERGENLAARELRNKGYRIIARNFKCVMGEIDIVARDGKTLVFVEVKTRASDDPATPEEQVNPAKMHQCTKAAKFYLNRYGQPQPPARFDVVAVVWPQGRTPTIRHIENAFEPTF
jgi:putative endonuclease